MIVEPGKVLAGR